MIEVQPQSNSLAEFSRKDFFKGGITLVGGLLAPSLFAEGEMHMHHNHGKNASLVAASTDCTVKGQLCQDHCIELVKQKDTSIAGCLETVTEMLAVCEGLTALANANSKHLKAYAKVCIDVCNSCITECEKHAKKHKECADCAEACKACVKELKKVA